MKSKIDPDVKKVEMIGTISEARDTIEDVKDFLEKDKQFFDDLALSHGPINLNTLSSIQKLKLTSLAQAKEREGVLKSHMEDIELLNLASGV